MKSVRAPLSAVIVLAMMLLGCDRQERTAQIVDPLEKMQQATGSTARERSGSGGGISMELTPESPTVKGDIKVALRGASGAENVAWQVNGTPIPDVAGRCLPQKYFSRGDHVLATIVSKGEEISAATRVGNSPPELGAVEASAPPVYHGTAIEVKPEAIDADGDDVEFRFVWAINGDTLHWEEGATLAGDKFRKGDIVHLTIVPFDGESEGQPSHRMEFKVEDAPPIFVSAPPESFQSFEFIYPSLAVDPDGEAIEYALAEGPEGMTIDAVTGEVRWMVPADEHEEHKVRIIARNTAGVEVFQDFSLQIQKKENEQ